MLKEEVRKVALRLLVRAHGAGLASEAPSFLTTMTGRGGERGAGRANMGLGLGDEGPDAFLGFSVTQQGGVEAGQTCSATPSANMS